MLIQEFEKNSDYLLGLSREVRDKKRPDYTLGSENVLRNFDSISEDLDLPPEKILWVYMKKHLDALLSYVNEPGLKHSEPVELRFADSINYMLLLFSILRRRDGDGKA